MQVINRTASFLFLNDTISVEVSILKNEIDNSVHFIFSPQQKHFSQLSSSEPVKATSDMQGRILKLSLNEKNEKLARLFTIYVKRYVKEYFKDAQLSDTAL